MNYIDLGDLLYYPDKYLKTREDLEKIRNIRIRRMDLDDLNILKSFPNLERLEIINPNYEIESDDMDEYNPYFNHIKNYDALNYLNLRSLKIVNDTNIKRLDLSRMRRLSRLELINNPELNEVVIINERNKDLPLHLKNVLMYGNHITSFPNLDYYIFHTLDANKNIVDSSIYFCFIKNARMAKHLNDLYIKGLTNIHFSEKNGQVGYLDLDIPLITELYTHFYSLFRYKGLFNMKDEEKIYNVYKYITSNVSLAKNELYERQKSYFELMDKYGTIPEFYKRAFGSLHTSYYAYHFKRSNCEGMVNLMKFCLSILGIDSEDVHVHDIREHKSGTNHAILRCKLNGSESYFDPSYRSQKSLKDDYFNMSYDKASAYLDLSKYEKRLAYSSYLKKLDILSYHSYEEFLDYLSWLLGIFKNDKENEFKRQNKRKETIFDYYVMKGYEKLDNRNVKRHRKF